MLAKKRRKKSSKQAPPEPEVEAKSAPGHVFHMPYEFDLSARVTSTGTRFEEGKDLRFHVQTSQECRVFLISHDSNGEVALILPCDNENDNLVFPSVEAKFPGMGNQQYSFKVEPPFGHEFIIVLAFASTAKCDFAKEIEAACKKQGSVSLGDFEAQLITHFREKHPKQKDIPWSSVCITMDTYQKQG